MLFGKKSGTDSLKRGVIPRSLAENFRNGRFTRPVHPRYSRSTGGWRPSHCKDRSSARLFVCWFDHARQRQASPSEIWAARRGSLPLTDRTSIAVLPFANLSGDPEQDYFSDGIVEDITTALSRNRAFFVIARNSSFTYKGKGRYQTSRTRAWRSLRPRRQCSQIGRPRARHRAVNRGGSGHHLWADRFEGDVADIFEIQDQIVTRVVGAIAPRLEKARWTVPASATTIWRPTICIFAALPIGPLDKGRQCKSVAAFYAAIEKDRDFSTPYGLAASCYFFAKVNNWASSFDRRRFSARRRGGRNRSEDPVALAGQDMFTRFFQRRRTRLAAHQSCAGTGCQSRVAWQRSGWVRAYAGDPTERSKV